MSHGARRFLLMPTHAQVWKLVLAYMELAERGTPGTRHATLTFLMRVPEAYSPPQLTPMDTSTRSS